MNHENMMNRDDMMKSLDRDGYVILPDVISEGTCDELLSSFWDYMEGMNSDICRTKPTTWTKENLPISTKGLIQHYNVGFQRFTVDAHMLLKPVFESIYGTNRLWTSFDGVSFTQKGKRPQFKDVPDWKTKCWESTAVHIDQTTPGFMSIQGGLAVTDQKEDEHVFVCVPGSHKFHEDLLKIWEQDADARFKEKNIAYEATIRELGAGEKKPVRPTRESATFHWEIMNDNQLAYLQQKGLEMQRIPLKRGSFVLWDSRTVHSSAGYCKSARADALRLQIFVCMRPVPDNDIEREMRIRRKAYTEGRVSKHSADHIRLFGKQPRMYSVKDKLTHDKMQVPESISMTKEEEELYGLRMYDYL